MAEHMMKKYIAKVEKTVFIVEELEILAETEKEEQALLDKSSDYEKKIEERI